MRLAMRADGTTQVTGAAVAMVEAMDMASAVTTAIVAALAETVETAAAVAETVETAADIADSQSETRGVRRAWSNPARLFSRLAQRHAARRQTIGLPDLPGEQAEADGVRLKFRDVAENLSILPGVRIGRRRPRCRPHIPREGMRRRHIAGRAAWGRRVDEENAFRHGYAMRWPGLARISPPTTGPTITKGCK